MMPTPPTTLKWTMLSPRTFGIVLIVRHLGVDFRRGIHVIRAYPETCSVGPKASERDRNIEGDPAQLKRENGNRTRAEARVRITRETLLAKIRIYGLE